MAFVTNFMKRPLFFMTVFRVLINFYYVIEFYDMAICDKICLQNLNKNSFSLFISSELKKCDKVIYSDMF